jgi:glycosyltransferase involved in cell wall biosynthesis
VNEIVVDHAKPDEIARRVKLLMNGPKIRKKLGENAYEYVKNNLSWEKYAKQIENIFQQTLSKNRRQDHGN